MLIEILVTAKRPFANKHEQLTPYDASLLTACSLR